MTLEITERVHRDARPRHWHKTALAIAWILPPRGGMSAGCRGFANASCGPKFRYVHLRRFKTSRGIVRAKIMSKQSRVAIVTGASQGIGAGLVTAFRELGYRVVANSRSIKPSSDPEVISVAGDIGQRAVAERIVKEALEHFGHIDTLVNNAGIFTAKPFTAFTEEDYAANLSVNLDGFFHITQFAIAEMERQGSGHVVNITTSLVDHAIDGVPSVLASLTKGGLNAATKSLAIEYAKRGVRVNAVAPGVIKTPMHALDTHEALGGLHPVGRMGEITDIADAVIYLDKANFVTGEILHVDGGQSAGH